MAHALILFTVIALATAGCKKTNDSTLFAKKIAGTYAFTGSEHIAYSINGVGDTTFALSPTIQITTVNDVTVATNIATSLAGYFMPDTLQYSGVNPAKHTVTFAHMVNLIDDGLADILVYNYANNTITLEQSESTGAVSYDLKIQTK